MLNEQWITDILTAPSSSQNVVHIGRNVVWREPDASLSVNAEKNEIRAQQVEHVGLGVETIARGLAEQAPYTDVGINAQQWRSVLAGAEVARVRISHAPERPIEIFLRTNEGLRWALVTQVVGDAVPTWRPEGLEAALAKIQSKAKEEPEPKPEPEPSGDSWELAAWEVQVRDVMNAQLKDRNWQIRMDENGEMWACGLPTLEESQVWVAQHFAAIKVSDLFAVAPPVALDYRTYVLTR